MRVVWGLYESYMRVVWGLYEGCMRVVWELYEGCMRVVWGLYEGCMRVVWELYESCMRVVWGLYEGCIKGCFIKGLWREGMQSRHESWTNDLEPLCLSLRLQTSAVLSPRLHFNFRSLYLFFIYLFGLTNHKLKYISS